MIGYFKGNIHKGDLEFTTPLPGNPQRYPHEASTTLIAVVDVKDNLIL